MTDDRSSARGWRDARRGAPKLRRRGTPDLRTYPLSQSIKQPDSPEVQEALVKLKAGTLTRDEAHAHSERALNHKLGR